MSISGSQLLQMSMLGMNQQNQAVQQALAQQQQTPQSTTTAPQQQQAQANPLAMAMLGFNNQQQQPYQQEANNAPIDPYAAMAVYGPNSQPNGTAPLDAMSFINASNLPTYS